MAHLRVTPLSCFSFLLFHFSFFVVSLNCFLLFLFFFFFQICLIAGISVRV